MKSYAWAAVLAVGLAGAGIAAAADHRDGPLTTGDPTADLNDVYAFMNPSNPAELIVIGTVVPFASYNSRFSDAVEYRFHFDNGASGPQLITCRFTDQSNNFNCSGPNGLNASGSVGGVRSGTGMRVYTGLRDDAFFFDVAAFNRTRTTLVPSFTNPGVNGFPGNTLAIVMGIERNRLTNNGANPTLKVYASTKRVGGSGVQSGITGAWYDAANPGHGFAIEVLPPATPGGPDRLYTIWQVYNNFGQQRWIYGVGPIQGNSASVTGLVTTGGTFPPRFTSSQVIQSTFGNLTFNFTNCNQGSVEFFGTAPEFGSGTINITRLTAIKDLPCSFLSSGQIDRNGRPGINTALIDLLANTGKKDAYNRAEDPASWSQLFRQEMINNLTALDTLDGVVGNSLLPPATLATVLVDDRLIINTSIATCGVYLAVELGVAGQCGGRTLTRDVIDDTLGAVIGPGVSDNVGNDSVLLTDFPYLGEPR